MSGANENKVIKLGSIPTDKGLLDTQGFRVYSIYGVGNTITVNTGGISGPGNGLYVVVEKWKPNQN